MDMKRILETAAPVDEYRDIYRHKGEAGELNVRTQQQFDDHNSRHAYIQTPKDTWCTLNSKESGV